MPCKSAGAMPARLKSVRPLSQICGDACMELEAVIVLKRLPESDATPKLVEVAGGLHSPIMPL